MQTVRPGQRAIDAAYQLSDRYERSEGRVFLTGTQALLRILLEQKRKDERAGIASAGLISGYRGSPLGGVDIELWRQRDLLAKHDIRFEPGLNEDLAATMLWGSQQIAAFPGPRVQGVFAMWYGKGPGVDRSGDVFRNANTLGTSRHGGVLAIAGDDHAAQSSMIPHQTDHIFEAAMIPVLYPSSVAEYSEFGLYGYAMSRYTGLWAGFKAITETVESGRSVMLGSARDFAEPQDFEPPPHGLHYDPRLLHPAQRQELERRVVEERLPALQAFMRANPIDRLIASPANGRARLGIVTVGKSHWDVVTALQRSGLTLDDLAARGVAIYKIGMSWPIEAEGIRRFAGGLGAMLVVEEKRSLVEAQIKDALFNLAADVRPVIEGKHDRDGRPLIPATLELVPEQLVTIVRSFLERYGVDPGGHHREEEQIAPASASNALLLNRKPFFCSGCPHNSSTKVPEGSFAAGGIGCHIMALGTNNTATFCQMGGEGIQWVGLSTFTAMPHLFVNLGDGTYQHSGSLAIRQAVIAGTSMTFKILFNDAVAMTGGQAIEGQLSVSDIVAQVRAEGVLHLAVVSEDPGRYTKGGFPPEVALHHRDELDAVQRDFRGRAGVSVIIYDQTCAAEKRRRRKRGEYPDPERRIFINPDVCEGCGDCSVQSNCIAVEPFDTELGRKRQINQSACNKDYSCINGFCPSFVSVEGAMLQRPDTRRADAEEAQLAAALPEPPHDLPDRPFHILAAGIGGTGVVTIGGILSMAAHLEGLEATTLDFTGVAQKNGTVVSHVKIAPDGQEIGAVRVGHGECDLLIGCDIVVAASAAVRQRLSERLTSAVVNRDITPTADFVADGDRPVAQTEHERVVAAAVGPDRFHLLDATRLATGLFGDAIATNLFLVGYAFQKGLIPLSSAAIARAIELNGASVAMNQRAFLWGRIEAANPGATGRLAQLDIPDDSPFDLASFVARRTRDLVDYQDEAYAARYAALVGHAETIDARLGANGKLTEAVARSYFKLLAYKDEYEVARLHCATLASHLGRKFDGKPKLKFHMAPPLLSRRDKRTGQTRKRSFAGWYMLPLLRILRHGRRLRGTALDPFGRQPDRRMERELVARYEADIALVAKADPQDTLPDILALLNLPGTIRGYGPVKMRSARQAGLEGDRLRTQIGARGRTAAAMEPNG